MKKMKIGRKKALLAGVIGSAVAAGITWIYGDMLGGTIGLLVFIASVLFLIGFLIAFSRKEKAPSKSAGVMGPEPAPVVSFEDNGAVIRFENWSREGSRILSNNDRGKAVDLGQAKKKTVVVNGKMYLADVIDGDRGVGVDIELASGPRDIQKILRFSDGQELEVPRDESKLPAPVRKQIEEAVNSGKVEMIQVDRGPLVKLLLDITNTAEEAWAFLDSAKMARTYTEDITGRSKIMFMGIGFIVAIMFRMIFGI